MTPRWSLDPELREILVCPACHGPLEDLDAGLGCRPCRRLFPVVDDVPWMIPEEAQAWEPDPSDEAPG